MGLTKRGGPPDRGEQRSRERGRVAANEEQREGERPKSGNERRAERESGGQRAGERVSEWRAGERVSETERWRP
jgi:hypothetical protein